MKLGFIFFVGVFANLMLASIFPYQLLPTDDATLLVGNEVYNYDLDDNAYFTTNTKSSASTLYSDLNDETKTEELLATNQQESNILESVSFFDGLFDALGKIAVYISLIIPFSSVLFLLPGAIGFVFGGIYSAILIYGIVRLIRGV